MHGFEGFVEEAAAAAASVVGFLSYPGSRKAPVIGDHMPPTKLLQGNKDQLGKWVRDLPVIGKVSSSRGSGLQQRSGAVL